MVMEHIIMAVMATMTFGNVARMTKRMGMIMFVSMMCMMFDANDDANGDHMVMISMLIAVVAIWVMMLAIMITWYALVMMRMLMMASTMA